MESLSSHIAGDRSADSAPEVGSRSKIYACVGAERDSRHLLQSSPSRVIDPAHGSKLSNTLRQTVLFGNAVKHVMRVLRVLDAGTDPDVVDVADQGPQRRQMLLVGPSGCGKRSSVRLASLIANVKMIDPDDASTYV